MKFKIAQVIGLNTDQKATQVLNQQREEDAFMAVLKLTCDDAFTKGRLFLSEFADLYFDFEGTPAEKLNATFTKAKQSLAKEGDFDLLLSSVSGKVLYLIGQGGVEVHLKRLDKLSSLLEVSSSGQIISGFLQVGDRILLATSSLITFLGSTLDKSLDLPLDTFEEEISSQVAAHPIPDETQLSPLAGLAIEISSEGEEEVIPLLQEEEQYEKVQNTEPKYIKNILTFAQSLITHFPKSNRGRLIVALVLMVIIAVGVGFQYKSSKDKEQKQQFNQNLQSAKDEFAAAKGLSSLNPTEAKNKLESAKNKVILALSLDPNNPQAQDLKKRIEEEAGSILQQFQASEFPLFLDLDLIKKDFKAQNLSLSVGKLLLLDPNTKTLVSIDIAKKSHQILSGKEKLGDAKYASINGSLAFVYSKDKGVIRIDVTSQKEASVSAQDKQWGQIQDIAGFAGNVYLLDTGQIWKYLPTTSGYSDKREYLTKKTEPDFSGVLRMQIESSIYVLKEGGEILRFTRGDKDHFSYGGLDKGIKDPKSFFVSSDTEDLYLLDSGNSRLVVVTKTGSYKQQYQGDKFAQASDLVVDEKGKKVYLLEGNKIYSVELK